MIYYCVMSCVIVTCYRSEASGIYSGVCCSGGHGG